MSVFVCGTFELRNAAGISDLERVGWAIVDEGRRERLYFHLYSAIPQPIVFEITKSSLEQLPTTRLPFLITTSPIWNVSDELVEDQASTIVTLSKLRRILERLASHFVGVEIYFSEGYDDAFESFEVSLNDFEAVVLARLPRAETACAVAAAVAARGCARHRVSCVRSNDSWKGWTGFACQVPKITGTAPPGAPR